VSGRTTLLGLCAAAGFSYLAAATVLGAITPADISGVRRALSRIRRSWVRPDQLDGAQILTTRGALDPSLTSHGNRLPSAGRDAMARPFAGISIDWSAADLPPEWSQIATRTSVVMPACTDKDLPPGIW